MLKRHPDGFGCSSLLIALLAGAYMLAYGAWLSARRWDQS